MCFSLSRKQRTAKVLSLYRGTRLRSVREAKAVKSTELNNYIEESRIKLHRIYTQFEENGKLSLPEYCRKSSLGWTKKVEQVRTIISTMRDERW